MMPLDLLRAKIGFKKAELYAPFLRKIYLRQGTSRSCEHRKCRLKALRGGSPVKEDINGRILRIASFKMPIKGYYFVVNEDHSRQKVIKNEVEVCIAIRMW